MFPCLFHFRIGPHKIHRRIKFPMISTYSANSEATNAFRMKSFISPRRHNLRAPFFAATNASGRAIDIKEICHWHKIWKPHTSRSKTLALTPRMDNQSRSNESRNMFAKGPCHSQLQNTLRWRHTSTNGSWAKHCDIPRRGCADEPDIVSSIDVCPWARLHDTGICKAMQFMIYSNSFCRSTSLSGVTGSSLAQRHLDNQSQNHVLPQTHIRGLPNHTLTYNDEIQVRFESAYLKNK